jgi:hypothetical protein
VNASTFEFSPSRSRSLFEVEAERFSLELTNGTVQPADFATYEGDDD